MVRLPELRVAYLSLNHRQFVFETEQLPTLLQTISDLNRRQLLVDADKENLLKSAPVALRKLTRDLHDVKQNLREVSVSQDVRLAQTDAKFDEALRGVTARIEATDDQVRSISDSVAYLLGRVEFVRREVMFEMRYGGKSPATESREIKAEHKIINGAKLAAARLGAIRLNLGCGHIPIKAYLNVDRRSLPGVDIVAEVDELPFEFGEVHEIFSAHLLEHFPQEQLRRELLPYFYRLLKNGGVFRAIVPDGQAMVEQYSGGNYAFEDLREVLYGAQDYDGDFHFNMFTPQSLQKLLEEAGYEKIVLIESGRLNGKCFEFEIVAEKPGGLSND